MDGYRQKTVWVTKIPPCLTPAKILNQQEYSLPDRTQTKHFADQSDNSAINCIGSDLSINMLNSL